MEHEQSTSHDMKSHTKEPERGKPSDMKQGTNHYVRLAMMMAASFVAMYVLMYAMVNVAGNAVPNVNRA